MVKFYLAFLICFPFSLISFSQEPKANNDQYVKQVRIQNNFPPLPVMKNTGNYEKDMEEFATEKEKWIKDVLTMYSNIISPKQMKHLKEV